VEELIQGHLPVVGVALGQEEALANFFRVDKGHTASTALDKRSYEDFVASHRELRRKAAYCMP